MLVYTLINFVSWNLDKCKISVFDHRFTVSIPVIYFAWFHNSYLLNSWIVYSNGDNFLGEGGGEAISIHTKFGGQ